ncbi:hypothetical protein CXG81DRAFT_19831 [Caulochytrium protostelioides]|uniref:Uncharacterized protein n=1 Tax=Caulochytrium protostelioides TaxID=1555241 RepID=A0A4V1IUD4_9FUNG|nr:hypothetical protein CXG81DRAFT_19831 [Caulochytrium protostelioides]|eukprot:RKP00169.1 hypothetical protein CXG81DRAFT_19831 [Caulochytrium protostelioides]
MHSVGGVGGGERNGDGGPQAFPSRGGRRTPPPPLPFPGGARAPASHAAHNGLMGALGGHAMPKAGVAHAMRRLTGGDGLGTSGIGGGIGGGGIGGGGGGGRVARGPARRRPPVMAPQHRINDHARPFPSAVGARQGRLPHDRSAALPPPPPPPPMPPPPRP